MGGRCRDVFFIDNSTLKFLICFVRKTKLQTSSEIFESLQPMKPYPLPPCVFKTKFVTR